MNCATASRVIKNQTAELMQKNHSAVDTAANNIHLQLAVSILPKTKPDRNVLNFCSVLLFCVTTKQPPIVPYYA
jgi:hypothetical protein